MTDNTDDVKIKVVKLVVLIFTLLIIAGAGFLLYLIANKKKANQLFVPKQGVVATATQNVMLGQPKGSRIVSFTPQGNYIYVDVEGGMLPERIILVDVNLGKVISTITLSSND